MPEIQGRHRKSAEAWAEKHRPARGRASSVRIDGYAQALADVEDANGYDLTACRAAYALVCEAVTPGAGPGGAAAVAISVQLLRRRAERAEAERDRLHELEGDPAQRMLNAICAFLRASSLWDRQGGDMKAVDIADVLERKFGDGDD